mmetsp:Transcript_12929/g.29358  ORF Transcript_12929/g.29358 Transcript_12929/m.29358 type:complete len:80 (-) Transcript_12929:6-245(-)
MYGSLESKRLLHGHVDFKTWMLEHQGLFPALHSLVSFAILGVPTIIGLQLGMDPSVRYWIGWHAWLVISVPVLLVAPVA